MSNILIIGDSCEDVWSYGQCDRICPDGPVPVFVPLYEKQNKGMAGNVYNNIKSIIKNLKVDVNIEFMTNTEIVIKNRFVEEKSNHLIMRLDTGENVVTEFNMNQLNTSLYDMIVISDYDKGFLTRKCIQSICESHDTVVIDTKKPIDSFCKSAKFIKINHHEYDNSRLHLSKLLSNTDFEDNLIVTLGSNGCKFQNNIYEVEKVEVKDTVGAGDTFLAGFAVNFLLYNDIDTAINYANNCATKVVQMRGVNII